MIKAVALDRDGTLIEHIPYLSDIKDVNILPTVVDALLLLKAQNIDLFVVTNQSGIGRGFFGVDDYLKVESYIARLFEGYGISFKKVYYCPYHPEHGVGHYKMDSEDRKPKPGMLVKLMAEFNIESTEIVMVGDNNVDIQAAKNADIQSVLVTTGYGSQFKDDKELAPNYVADSLLDAVKNFILV